MGTLLGFILDDVCVRIGIIVMWVCRGCHKSLAQELNRLDPGDFVWGGRHREGFLGAATILLLSALAVTYYRGG